VPGTFAVIGSRAGLPGGGSIRVAADGEIALNSSGPEQASIIRTLEDVTLIARSITQGPDSFIEAGSLTVQTAEGASLTGMNAVDVFSASNWASGGVALNNASPLLTILEVINPIGEVALQQTGDMRVSGTVASGVQSIDVSGGLIVQNEPGSFAQLGAQGGQTIHAGYLEVNAQAGGSASIFNFGGAQHVATSSANAAGEGLAVRTVGGNFAAIDGATGSQHIEIRNADRVVIDGATGVAGLFSFQGIQSLELSGSGANALVLGSPGALAQAVIGGGGVQTVVAGGAGEQGSITLHGTQGGIGNTLIVSNPVPGGSQHVSTPGAISVFGGSAPVNSTAGIFSNGAGGQQTIRAGSILLQGGATGFGNAAMIGANSGSQSIETGTGGITLRGGATGGNNFAMINQASTDPAASQTITSAGPVLLEGGSGNFNFAMIRAFGGHQDLEFGDTTLLAGATGIDNFSVIQAREQDVTVHGDLVIASRASGGSPAIGGGARIGGLGGGAPTPTNLRLSVDGDFTMTGGDLAGTGVALGNTTTFAGDTNIDVSVGGNVSMNGGSVPGTFAVIGSRAGLARGGSIRVAAGGEIALNSSGPEQASIIRTLEDVTLIARSITQGPDSSIEAGSLTVRTAEGASLTGTNAVEWLTMSNSLSGGVDFRNASALLTVDGIDQVSSGALNVNQDGNLRVVGDVTSGSQSISASGDMTVAAGDGPGVTVQAFGAQSFNVGGSFSLLGGTAAGGFAQTLASGPVAVTTGGDLNVRGGGGLLAYALMYGGESMHLTVGNEVHVDGGSAVLAFARVQTDFWEKIFLSFPNASGGSYFVDGREGVSNRGLDGFFSGLMPARPGRGLILSYGL